MFFSTFFLKETCICFNHNIVKQLLHRRLVLCLNILIPLTFCAFSKLTPKIKLFTPIQNPRPLPLGRNKRSVPNKIGFLRWKVNSKLDFREKRQSFDGKKQNWDTMRRNISRDINKLVCEVRRTENCSFISIFTLILKPLLAQVT